MRFTAFLALGPTGAPLNAPRATVTFSTGAPANVYASSAGGTPISQPVVGSSAGLIQFWAPDGIYNISVTSADGTYTLPAIENVEIFDLSGSAINNAFNPNRLEFYARVAGITLGAGNDQPAFDAAHAAMAARASQKTLLFVYVPPGKYNVSQLKLYNCAGFYCDPYTVLLQYQPWSETGGLQGVVYADLDIDNENDLGSSAVIVKFRGFIMDGGWEPQFTNEADPGYFHYAASEYSSSDPERTATVGQTAVYLRGAFDDAAETFNANSPFTGFLGDPRFDVGDLLITNFAGDGFWKQGGGEGIISNIRAWNCGGRGVVLGSYDNNIVAIDAGNCGLESMVFRANCSQNRILGSKAWFSGQRANAGTTSWTQDAGHKTAYWLDRCLNLIGILEAQDSVGSAYKLTSVTAPHLILTANWGGLSPSLQTAVCGGIDFTRSEFSAPTVCLGGNISLTMNRDIFGSGPYTQVQYAINAPTEDCPVVGTIIDVAQINLTGDTGSEIESSWIAGPAANWDFASIRFGAAQKVPNQWLVNSAGKANFLAPGAGGGAGVIGQTNGQATLLGFNRSVQQSVTIYDPTTGVTAYLSPIVWQLDASGNMQLGFFGNAAQGRPTAAGFATATVPGSGTPMYFDSESNGGIGSTNYTFGDIVAALKTLGLIAQ